MKFPVVLVSVSLALSVVIGLTLRRQGPEAITGPHRLRIGLSLDTLEVERWQRDRDQFTKAANRLGADVVAVSASGDDLRQIRDCEALINTAVDVLVIVPHDGTAMGEAVRSAHNAHIPVLAYDRMILNSAPDVYVTCDNIRVGEMQAQYLVDHLQGRKARIIRIIGPKSDSNSALFELGQDHVLNPLIARHEIEIVHQDYDDGWRADIAKRIVSAGITAAGRNIDAVLSPGDFTSGAAIQALLEEGLAGKVLVTGQDAELVACQRIVAGTQSMTVYKPLKLLADTAAEIAVKLARHDVLVAKATLNNGTADIPTVLLPVYLVDKDTMDSTVIKDGFHTRADVYGK
jgi:D-xylose transport system substrate-binding protein